jgi:methionyl-tRNA formyltransferase
MGSGSFSLPVLTALLDGGPRLDAPVQVAGVVSQPDRPAGRGRRLRPNPITALARDRALPLMQPQRLRARDALAELSALRPDISVVAAYGQILPAAALAIPPHGSLNLHPSLLPLHRGPSPVIGTILAGDRHTGSTLMLMSETMDAGPIVSQVETQVGDAETAGELELRLGRLSGELLLRNLPAWLEGGLQPAAQDESLATYTRLLSKDDAHIDWRQPAEEIDRRIRAFDPWPVAHSYWDGQLVRLFRPRTFPGRADAGLVLGLEDESLAVAAGEGIVLIEELQFAGARRLPAADVVRGHPDLLGARLV